MKKNFIRLFSILFLVLSFTNCKTTHVESDSAENTKDKNSRIIVLYDRNAKETYYLENKKEIKKVLSLLPKIPNVAYNTKYMLTSGLFNEHPYADYTLYVKKNRKITKEYHIDIDNRVWITNKSFLTTWFFPRKNIEKIISKMHKGVKHTVIISDVSEQRRFIEELRADDNVLYIDPNTEMMFDLYMGSFYLYVPGSKDEIINSREISSEVLDNLREHYGDTKNTIGKAIHNYTHPELTRYIEETQEYEFKMRWTKEMYDKIDIYRKSEFSSESQALHDIIEYYTKD